MSVESMPEFPVSSLLPKKETGILSFLNKYPKYDGTGIVIAVFDSGVDPAAPGLQTCTNGTVKILDRLDASGAGDVDTSVVRAPNADGTLPGLTGRTLKIPSSWHNPSGQFHLGVKSAYSLYPSKLREKLMKERKEQFFEPQHKKLQEDAMRKVQKQRHNNSVSTLASASSADDNESSSCEGGASKGLLLGCCSQDTLPADSDSNTAMGCQSSGTPGPVPSQSVNYSSFLEKQMKEEAEAEVALLSTLIKKHQDIGPAYDCVVYHDGKCWRACIDTSEKGDLESGVHLGEYRHTHEWSFLNARDSFTVSINVHNDGNVLEVVGMCSSHGTHVSSIAAAHFPGQPERCGVAPGAQIVSITIGDSRVHGMETGTALSRAMSWVMDNPFYKVDIINMSYGEHSHSAVAGRLGEMACDVVNKYGILWVASASNHGPGLSTVGSPPDFYSDCIIGIGAYISPDMMRAEYSMMDKLPGTAYTWSSRGPTTDGGRGVSVCAPGGAITSMPSFTNKTSQLLNGTSMSSPHAAGCAALLLSGLRQAGRCYTPYSVRRAIQNTALRLDLEPFVQGHGLIQVEKAFEYLLENSAADQSKMAPEDKMRFVIECGNKSQKGIYLRNWLGNKSVDVSVTVEPIQFDEARGDDEVKRSLNLDLVLACDAPWVSCPDCLQMSYTPRSLVVRINPHGLERGRVHFTSIRAYVAGAVQRGPLFDIPVTVVVPIVELEHGYFFKSQPEVYRAGCVRRLFVRVPEGASWAQFAIKSSNSDQNQRMTLHAVQLFPQCCVLTYDHYKTFSCLYPEEQSVTSFAVNPGLTLELCVARWWAAPHDTTIEFSVSFHGIRPTSDNITLFSNSSVQRVDVISKLRSEEIWAQAVVKHHVQSLLPYESRIEVLGGLRDTIPVGRPIYQLVLSYALSVPKTTEVQPKCCLLNDYLYESAVESQLWMLFDSKKQYLGAGDAYSHKYSIKLDKGEYVVKQHVRHEKTELLEKLQEMPMTIITKLSQEVKLDAYATHYNALTGGKKMGCSVMQPGEIVPIFFNMPNLQDKVFKSLNLSAGHVLSGTVSFAKDDLARRVDLYPLRIVLCEPINWKKRGPTAAGDDARKESKVTSEYSDAVRDMKINWITKLEYSASETLYREVCQEHPNFLQTHVARLLNIDNHFNTPPFGASTVCTYAAYDDFCTCHQNEEAEVISTVEAASEPEQATTTTATSEVEAQCDQQEDPHPPIPEENQEVSEEDESSGIKRRRDIWLQWRDAVVEASSQVLKCVDLPELLSFLGTKLDARSDANKTKMERHKMAIIDALCKKGLALAFPYVPRLLYWYPSSGTSETSYPLPPDAVLTELDSIAITILKLIEPSDAKVMSFFVSYYQVRRLYATAARLLLKHLEDKHLKEGTLRLATLYHLLGYHHIVEEIFRSLPLRFPEKYLSF
ncbi:tripeptidyl-peptidase 2 isoform X2 [Hyalella azteca]|uniref:Tripeptidyl-peptidase 2 n=1 Tax=Hyalella azteca TaxID=294128 RepID=A0A8B7PAB1_HYAAZ|nr:tripeptidyl-peptidase 2 isoform X2 [Hyalella azteca]